VDPEGLALDVTFEVELATDVWGAVPLELIAEEDVESRVCPVEEVDGTSEFDVVDVVSALVEP